MKIRTIERRNDGAVVLLDQRKLPAEETYVTCTRWQEVAEAITTMVVRGAPAIGVTAAYGLALAARESKTDDLQDFRAAMETALDTMAVARPTAVNLGWAVERMRAIIAKADGTQAAREQLDAEAMRIDQDDQARCRQIGEHGSKIVPNGARVLTHCNTGALATAGIGTALGVIRAAHEAGKVARVYADETRPWLQGARLTTWECQQSNIPVSLLPDSVAADLMRRGLVDLVIVGADRIAANGDTANKIGTYSVAIAAAHHSIPFYVAAPRSTIDFSISDGSQIPIEQRDPTEVTHVQGKQIAPDGVEALNPAFDVTPARLIKGIITEVGVARAPFTKSLAR